MGFLEKIFGTHSENELKRIYPIVDKIEALDEEMQALSDEELKDKTRQFKERLSAGETLDDYLLNKVFNGQTGEELQPEKADAEGFDTFIERYKKGFPIEHAAIENM